MKIIHSQVELEKAERSLNTPTHAVKGTKIVQRELIHREICKQELIGTVRKTQLHQTEGQSIRIGFVSGRNKVKSPQGMKPFILFWKLFSKGLVFSGKPEIKGGLAFVGRRQSATAERGTHFVNIPGPYQEIMMVFNNMSQNIVAQEATIRNEKAAAGELAAVNHRTAGIGLVQFPFWLDNGINISLFEQIKQNNGMELVITSVIGIKRDEREGIRFIGGNIGVGTITGDQMKTLIQFSEREFTVKALQQMWESRSIQLSAILDKGGFRERLFFPAAVKLE